MPQETEDEARREFGSEPCGGGNSLRQTWSLNHTFGNQPGDRPSCVGPSDHGERIECGSLFWYDPIKTKTGEAPTQGLESGHRCRQAAPSRFGSQLETIMHASLWRAATSLSSSSMFHAMTGRLSMWRGARSTGPALV